MEIAKENGEIINIHAGNDEAFMSSCRNGCLEVIKWLIEILKENGEMININKYYERVFRWSCYFGNKEVAKWLCSLFNNYYIEIKNNKIIKYGIKNMYDKYLDENKGIKKIIKKLQLKII